MDSRTERISFTLRAVVARDENIKRMASLPLVSEETWKKHWGLNDPTTRRKRERLKNKQN